MNKLRKLTKQEYFDLQTQYKKTPLPYESFGATGEHFIYNAIALPEAVALFNPQIGERPSAAD